jgi:putative flippase GtrA
MINNFIRYIRKNFDFIYRFVMVGIFTFLINFILVYFFDQKIKLDYKKSVSIAYVITLVCHFLLNRAFTFKVDYFDFAHLLRYSILPIINFFISLSIAFVVVEIIRLPVYYSVFFSAIFSAFISYTLLKYFVFLKVE